MIFTVTIKQWTFNFSGPLGTGKIFFRSLRSRLANTANISLFVILTLGSSNERSFRTAAGERSELRLRLVSPPGIEMPPVGFFNVAPVIRQGVDGLQRELLRSHRQWKITTATNLVNYIDPVTSEILCCMMRAWWRCVQASFVEWLSVVRESWTLGAASTWRGRLPVCG